MEDEQNLHKSMRPTDGFIWGADPEPEDNRFLSIRMIYTEDNESDEGREAHKTRRFFLEKSTAKVLVEVLSEILAAPDAETARKNMEDKANAAERCHEINWDEIDADEANAVEKGLGIN